MTSSLECDVLVVGGGAGALTGALTAATLGLDVILAEKTEYLAVQPLTPEPDCGYH